MFHVKQDFVCYILTHPSLLYKMFLCPFVDIERKEIYE